MEAEVSLKFSRTSFPALLALWVLAAGLFGPATVRADEYGDVNQLVAAGKLNEALAKADLYLANKPKDPKVASDN